ncbi:glycosyl hydrolase [Caulobacter sp. BK020]|uniref:GH39 family glycosyl hydrolase n=1 Tax=Caulobacter sp. BK020 TaxID=2512117 RepID=UPI001FB1B476|nr:glycosyl hydrolase [Caulobacter sp. BK020]
MLNRRDLIATAGALATTAAALSSSARAASAPLATETVDVDLTADEGALRHIWSECVGSDRAGLTMREEWRLDAKRAHKEAGIKSVRFHGIFNDDEMGVRPKASFGPGAQSYNFQNVDNVYDGVLDSGLKPWVELSFMPTKLASGNANFGTYHGNITPPASLDDWKAFIAEFVRHLIARYGVDEVRTWYFEVWNEPDLGFFWSGTQAQYFELYKASVEAVKGVDPALKVGGPATSKVQWIPAFLDYCAQNRLPVDFVSTHLYAGDNQKIVFGEAGKYTQNQVYEAAMKMVSEQIAASAYKDAELWLGEWSSDSPAMIAHIVKGCLPYVRGMSYWQISKFEEVLIPNFVFKEGDNAWGLFSARNVARPTFNTFKLMNRLGERRVKAVGPALATRRNRGGGAVMVWNLAEAQQASGIPGANSVRKVTGEAKRYTVRLKGAKPGQAVKVSYVDMERGSPYPAWRVLGSPQYPTREQLAKIRAAAELPAPQGLTLNKAGEVVVDLPPEGVALIELA